MSTTETTRILSPRGLSGLGITAVAALALTACGADDSLDTTGDGEPNSTVTLGADPDEPEDETDEAEAETDAETDTDAQDAGTDQPAEAGADETDDAEADTEAETEAEADTEADDGDGTDQPAEAGADHPLYGGLQAVQAAHPEGVVFEVESDDGRYEWRVYVNGVEREIHTEKSTLEIVHTEDDDVPDGDDLREIDAVQVDFSEAFRAAEEHAGSTDGAFVEEAELDTEGGVVVWVLELDSEREVYVDVSSAEVIYTED